MHQSNSAGFDFDTYGRPDSRILPDPGLVMRFSLRAGLGSKEPCGNLKTRFQIMNRRRAETAICGLSVFNTKSEEPDALQLREEALMDVSPKSERKLLAEKISLLFNALNRI